MQNRWFGRSTVKYPPSLPNLTHVNFFVRGFLKDKVCSRKPETIAKMREPIEKECAQIPQEILLNVARYIFSRYKMRIEQNGTSLRTYVNLSLWKHFQIAPSVFYLFKS